MKYDMDMMLRLRLLPWKDAVKINQGKDVTVIVSDYDHLRGFIATPRWTRTEILAVIETLYARLAALNSMEIYKVEVSL